MSIEKLIGDLIAALNENTQALKAAGVAPVAAAKVEPKPEPKAEVKEQKATPVAEAVKPAPEVAAEPEAGGIDFDALRKKIADMVTKGAAKDRAGVVSILETFGVARASQLPNEKLELFASTLAKRLELDI